MSVNLKVTLGTVNYTDFLHVTAAKVSAPGTIVWETWIDVPVTNYNFVIPNLDPENYIISYYDAPTDSDLGELRMQLIVNALTSEFLYEKRYYKTDRGNDGDPVNGSRVIADDYLIGKTITEVFKEGFRELVPDDEYVFDDEAGEITTEDTISEFATDEVIIVTLRYAAGTIASSTGTPLYAGTLDVTEDFKTLTSDDRNKRIRCVGSDSTQEITLPALSSLAVDDGFLFDNCCGGAAKQVVIAFPDTDRLLFNGFTGEADLFATFWISKGEVLKIVKYTYESVSRWELVTEYKGVNVGERFAATLKTHPNTLPEDGSLQTASAHPRLAYWLQFLVPATHLIIDNDITSDTWSRPAGKNGLFAVNADYSFFRMPDTQNLSERGLKDFNTYGIGTDAERLYNYPGGQQDDQNKAHSHRVNTTGNQGGVDPGRALQRGSTNGDGYGANGTGIGTGGPYIEEVGGDEVRVKNFGVIYLRRI